MSGDDARCEARRCDDPDREGRKLVNLDIRPITAADIPECGRICFEAFEAIARSHNFPPDFPSVDVATELASSLVAHPGFFSVVAESDGDVVGSNFLDERGPIFSVGPVTVDPKMQNSHVGRALMAAVLQRSAQRDALGVRLVQMAYHNRSMSLYAKLGFDVREPLATLQGHPVASQIHGYPIRPATDDDVKACNALCSSVHGHDRGGELSDAVAQGTAKVVERGNRITGYTTGIGLFRHAVAETNDDLVALIAGASEFSGPGFLVPMRNTDLLRWCLEQRLRVVHMANLMTTGFYREPNGAFIASIGY
jgi:predicted N-acetyltransferase YhbS